MAENAILESLFESLISQRRKRIRKIVDFGCGTGLGYELSRKILLENSDAEYVGYDISEKMLNISRRKHDNIRVLKEDFNKISIETILSNVDAVLMTFGSFSYVESPHKFLSSIQRILTPDAGHLLLMAYSRFSIRNLLLAQESNDNTYLAPRRSYAFRNDITDGEKAPANFYTSAQITTLLSEAGFQWVNVVGMNFNSVKEEECSNVEEARKRLREEMDKAINPNSAHALIMRARNYA